LSAAQSCEGGLDRALGKAGSFGHGAKTGGDTFKAASLRLAVEIKINQKCSRLAIVTDQIAEEDIEDIIINRNGPMEAGHESNLHSYTVKWTVICWPGRHPLSTERHESFNLADVMIKRIKFISIPVADQNRALDFYTDKLGFTIITDQPFDDKQRWIELRVPKAETRVVLFTPEGDEKRVGNFMNMSYECDDIDDTYKILREGNRFVLSAA
jgi:lactoylglutathione lyase